MNRKELYLQGIKLITDYFAKLGINVTVGLEIEFLAPRPADKDGKSFFGEIPPKEKNKDPDNHTVPEDFLARYNEIFKERIKDIAKKAGGIMGTIVEVPIDKYETIICPMSPLASITAAEKVKSVIVTEMLPELAKSGWANRVSFGSYEGRVIPALHTNIGLNINGRDLFKESDFAPTDFMEAIAEGMKAALHETTVLVAPFPSSYSRYKSKDHISYPKQVAVNKESWNKDERCILLKYREVPSDHCMFPENGEGNHQYVHWIENRLPSGDCQPYVSTFTTLLSLYDAFRKVVKLDEQDKLFLDENGFPQLNGDAKAPRKNHKISTDFQDARKVFTAGKILGKRMDELDPENKLGSEIKELEIQNQRKIRSKSKTFQHGTENLGALRS